MARNGPLRPGGVALPPSRPWVLAALLLVPVLLPALPAPGSGDPMASESWVVVAVVDTGVNPYHREFGAGTYPVAGKDFTRHPSTYLAGYPASAPALDLTLGASTYRDARAEDDPVWRALGESARGGLRWIPGTKIVGIVDSGDDGFVGSRDATSGLDDDGHGTAVASLAAGNTLGACPRCLLVVVEDPRGLAWAAAQPWIDLVVNSWGAIGNAGVPGAAGGALGFDAPAATRAAAECGGTVLFATGNGVENAFLVAEQTYASEYTGPAWVLRVGAYSESASGRRALLGSGKPADVLAEGLDATAAEARTLAGERTFSGTSAAAPIAGGALAETLRLVRALFADTAEGRTCAGQGVAEGAPRGSALLADGRLSRGELWRAFRAAAAPGVLDGDGLLPPDVRGWMVRPLAEGWGTVDASTAARAFGYLEGGVPSRPDAEAFSGQDESVRDALFGPWDKDGDGAREARPPAPAWPRVLP